MANEDMRQRWTDVSGRAWVEHQRLFDRMLAGVTRHLLAALDVEHGERVIDVGCGTGTLTGAVADLGAHVVGADISPTMVEGARRRFPDLDFVVADAQLDPLPGPFDQIVSRFGVMFFDDPVAAFANLRRAATKDAELRFLSWRGPAENPFMLVAERAAAPFLPGMPPRDPDAPGQFMFADARRVERILADSGWADIVIEPADVECRFPADELVRWFTQLGPLGRVLHEADGPTRNRIIDAVRPAYDAFVHGDEIRFNAAAWLVVARPSGETRG